MKFILSILFFTSISYQTDCLAQYFEQQIKSPKNSVNAPKELFFLMHGQTNTVIRHWNRIEDNCKYHQSLGAPLLTNENNVFISNYIPRLKQDLEMCFYDRFAQKLTDQISNSYHKSNVENSGLFDFISTFSSGIQIPKNRSELHNCNKDIDLLKITIQPVMNRFSYPGKNWCESFK